jgi:uncharacterized protein YdeI (YjbR/CyaY-like superfamily)
VKERPGLYVEDRKTWRAWLARHHAAAREIWLVYYKKETGRPSIPNEDSVEEALCFGWIDSLIRKLDEERYARKFTPRTNLTKWSKSNRRRVEKLIREGRIIPAGLASLGDLRAGSPPPALKHNWEMPDELAQAVAANETARRNFEKLAPSHRRQYVGWIASARKPETRLRRAAEAKALMARNEKLSMK